MIYVHFQRPDSDLFKSELHRLKQTISSSNLKPLKLLWIYNFPKFDDLTAVRNENHDSSNFSYNQNFDLGSKMFCPPPPKIKVKHCLSSLCLEIGPYKEHRQILLLPGTNIQQCLNEYCTIFNAMCKLIIQSIEISEIEQTYFCRFWLYQKIWRVDHWSYYLITNEVAMLTDKERWVIFGKPLKNVTMIAIFVMYFQFHLTTVRYWSRETLEKYIMHPDYV